MLHPPAAGETLDCALHLFLPRIASPQPKTLAHAPCRSGPETHSGNLRNAAMVWFQCEDCGENLKKPKLAGHFRSCSAYKVTRRLSLSLLDRTNQRTPLLCGWPVLFIEALVLFPNIEQEGSPATS